MLGPLTVFSLFLVEQAGSAGVINNLQSSVNVGELKEECWSTNSKESRACNDNGFCNSNWAQAQCSCFYGFGGTSCELNVRALICSQMDCGFSGIQGECIVEINDEAKCTCYTGWSGPSCSINVDDVDYCEGISCNNQGKCVIDLSSETNWSCECSTGWGGTDCGEELPECDQYFLLDMFTRLVSVSGDLDPSLDCGYTKPVVYSALHPSKYDTDEYAPCVCISMIEEFAIDDYNHLENTCKMDIYRDIPFMEQVKSYCPGCSDSQDDIMEEVLTTKSAACYHFIYQRTTMALYWRSKWKCDCVVDVGVQSTIATIINCPFTKHNSVNDYISYENCGARKICEWDIMYRYFEVEYSKKSLEGSVACKNWMEEWVFSVPGEQRFEEMSDTFCPCLDYLKVTGDESILDCIPVTFHQLTMVEVYDQICFDVKIANLECLNYISYGSIRLANTNYTAGSLCWGAVELASGLDSISDNLLTLMCDCLVPVYDDDYDYGDTTMEAIKCLLDYYRDFELGMCPNYDDRGTVHVSPKLLPTVKSFNTVSLGSESVWKQTAIIEIPVCLILVTTAFFLQRRKSKLNM